MGKKPKWIFFIPDANITSVKFLEYWPTMTQPFRFYKSSESFDLPPQVLSSSCRTRSRGQEQRDWPSPMAMQMCEHPPLSPTHGWSAVNQQSKMEIKVCPGNCRNVGVEDWSNTTTASVEPCSWPWCPFTLRFFPDYPFPIWKRSEAVSKIAYTALAW